MTNLIDYAWAQIPAQSIKEAGYIAAVRYLGGSAALTPIERDNLFAAGLGISLVYETAADEADHPERGYQDAINANREATSLGYPQTCPIFYADDQNDPDVQQELDYFQGVWSAAQRPVGVYSGGNVVKAVMDRGTADYGWMVETWYSHDGASPHLIQLANSKEPYITGVDPGEYDSNVLVKQFPIWGLSDVTDPPTQQPRKARNMVEVSYNNVAYHVWAYGGKVYYRAYKNGTAQQVITVPGTYKVEMTTPFPMVVGPFIYFAASGGKEVLVAPSAYGLVGQVQ